MQHHGAALRAVVERDGDPREQPAGGGDAPGSSERAAGTGGADRDLASALARGWRSAGLPERLRAILDYAERLTLEPGEIGAADLDPLRAAGLEDEAILHVAEVVSYFNFVNRMADGLGVRLESSWSAPPVPLSGDSRGSTGEGP